MSQTIELGDQTVRLGDFSGCKFFEAMGLLGEIMEAVPLADEKITEYTKQWLAANGAERVFDRATARYMLGEAIDPITDEEWQASGQTLKLAKGPDGSAAFMRAFPPVYRHAREQVERLICLIATPNSKLAEADDKGELDSIYEQGGAVHEQRRLVLHEAKVSQQMKLVIGSVRQLAEELREADVGGDLGELRAAVATLNAALNPTAASNDEPDTPDDEPSDESDATAPDVPVSAPSSSTPS
jgi:hypothetical protein